MSLYETGGAADIVPTAPPDGRSAPLARREGSGDVLFGAAVAGVLVAAGALLGLLWAWWTPLGPLAIIYPDGAILPNDDERFIGADGRFVIIVAAVGLLSGLAAWLLFRRRRGAILVAALAVGSVLGSLATWFVGHLTGGGDGTGVARELTDGTRVRLTNHLPISVHAHGLLFVQAAVAVLVYALFVAFSSHDDLGRPDPVRTRLLGERAQPSVDAGDQPQGGRGDRDAPGAPQQGDLAPQ